ncbi:hypothetical protein GCM10020360_28960 [Nonlabens tegetincola]
MPGAGDLGDTASALVPEAAFLGAGESPAADAASERLARLRGGEWGQAFQTTPHPAHNALFATAHASARAIGSALSAPVPALEEFFARGAAEGPGSAPASELVPILAPHGLGLRAWQRAAAHTALLPAIACATELRRWLPALDRAPAASVGAVRARAARGPVTWTLRWISAAATPGGLGEPLTPEVAAAAPSLPEMLALQASLRFAGLPLVDEHSFTWLAGALPDPALAARHTYDAATDAIRLSARVRADRGAHVGSRGAR